LRFEKNISHKSGNRRIEMRKILATLAMLGVCILIGTAGSTPAAAQARNISIKGSDTMVLLGQRWAETYMKKNPGVTIQVTGGGSGVGLAALINGTTDIAEASRPMKDSEKEQLMKNRSLPTFELPVALDGLAVYVHEKNGLTEISLEQLKKIYTGVVKNWKEVGAQFHCWPFLQCLPELTSRTCQSLLKI
jgi:phosphate transport system substrate-binding protein